MTTLNLICSCKVFPIYFLVDGLRKANAHVYHLVVIAIAIDSYTLYSIASYIAS